MEKKPILVLMQVLIMGILVCGCISPEVSNVDLTADDIISNMLDSIDGISYYKYSADVKITTSLINETGINTTESSVIQNGEVDLINKKLTQENTGTGASIYGEQKLSVYIVDGIKYSGQLENGIIRWSGYPTNIGSPDSANMTWNAYSALEGQKLSFTDEVIEGFDNYSLSKLTDDNFDGYDCFVVQVLTSYQNQSDFMFGSISQESDIKYWIAKDNFLLLKLESTSTTESSGMYVIGSKDADESILISEMDIIFYDYNIPVDIVVPPEALT